MALVKAVVERDFATAEELLCDPNCNVNEIGNICNYKGMRTLTIQGTPLMAAVGYMLYRNDPEDTAYYTLIKLLLNHRRCDINYLTNNHWVTKCWPEYQNMYLFLPFTALQFAMASSNNITKTINS